MRLVAALTFLLAGCAELSGLDSLGVCDGACADDATLADAPLPDAAADVRDTNDGSQIVDAGALDAGNDGAAKVCYSQKDCQDAVCCEQILRSGTSQSCKVDAEVIGCEPAASCPTTFPFTCSNAILRRCDANADCTEQAANACCTIPIGDAATHVCSTAALAPLFGGTCP